MDNASNGVIHPNGLESLKERSSTLKRYFHMKLLFRKVEKTNSARKGKNRNEQGYKILQIVIFLETGYCAFNTNWHDEFSGGV